VEKHSNRAFFKTCSHLASWVPLEPARRDTFKNAIKTKSAYSAFLQVSGLAGEKSLCTVEAKKLFFQKTKYEVEQTTGAPPTNQTPDLPWYDPGSPRSPEARRKNKVGAPEWGAGRQKKNFLQKFSQ
jgi:hypothetical protein